MATTTCINIDESQTNGVTAAVLPEITCMAGCETPLVGASLQSVSPQFPFSGRQPREGCDSPSMGPGASCQAESRARTDSGIAQPRAINENEMDGVLDGIVEPPNPSNPYSVLPEIAGGCQFAEGLGRKAKRLVEWFSSEMDQQPTSHPPAFIDCGGLRSAVESCFQNDDPVWKLSFKTVQKLEKGCCRECEPRFMAKLEQWKEARLAPVAVDESHLARFRRAFTMNVEKGWDKHRRPFVPNGNATLRFRRRDGGNWNLEDFSDECRTELVFSSGKPRVVTLYSAENTRRLGPLHYSLYDSLRRRGWLLVGDPTDRHVQDLNGAQFLSFDYQSATDNIKSAYVRVAIEVLKEKADHLDSSEVEALDVLGRLNLGDSVAQSGQPMGSVMSFPLLCVINKTVVDLALARLLEGKKISFREYSSHRCLINGDDLLTREVRSDTNLRALIAEEGSQIGLVVNDEKTMSSTDSAEINSTFFKNGEKMRKFNAAAVWMDAGTEDVLGFAAQASSSGATFAKLVRANRRTLAKQADKHLDELPYPLQAICRKDPKIRKALTSLPESSRTIERGVISMAQRPENYNLSRDEENEAMIEEIDRVRERGIARGSIKKPKFSTHVIPNAASFTSVLKRSRTVGQELIPACYERKWMNKKWEAVMEQEVAPPSDTPLPPGDGSVIGVIVDNLRAFKLTRNSSAKPGTIDAQADFVSLCC